MSTAVYIKSESGDDYLYSLEENLPEEEALDVVEKLCYEDRECWSHWIVKSS